VRKEYFYFILFYFILFLCFFKKNSHLFVVCMKTTNERIKISKQVTSSCMVGRVGDFALWRLNMISLFLTQ